MSLQPPNELLRTEVIATTSFPCASRVWVDGGGTAAFLFGTEGACHLSQNTADKSATAIARQPDGTMLRLDLGIATCTLTKPIVVCAPGSIFPTSQYVQFSTTCDPDPIFHVAVFAGTITVVTPGRDKFEMGPGQELRCDPNRCFEVKPTDGAAFSAQQRRIFALQSRQLNLSPNATAPG